MRVKTNIYYSRKYENIENVVFNLIKVLEQQYLIQPLDQVKNTISTLIDIKERKKLIYSLRNQKYLVSYEKRGIIRHI